MIPAPKCITGVLRPLYGVCLLLTLTPSELVGSSPPRSFGIGHDYLGARVLSGDSERGVEFGVWAPTATKAAVVGTFNEWRPRAMRKYPGGVWRAVVPEARAGDEYMFEFDAGIQLRDPRAREVSTSGKSVIIPPPPPAAVRAPPPAARELVIYQVHPGTFYDPTPSDDRPATLRDAVAKLDHLASLGVNCVLLMPVNEFSGERSWGYNPKDLFAIEQTYGGPEGLREFVRECHLRGIAVHIDVVHNHYGPDGLDLWGFDSVKAPSAKKVPSGPYFYGHPDKVNTPWGPRPDFGRREVGQFITDQIRMWFDEYGVDGLRWDSVVNIRAFDNGSRLNPEGERLLDRITRMVRREYPEKINIAEDSLGDPRFDASWDYGFHHDDRGGVVKNLLLPPDQADIADIAARLTSDLGFSRVVYSESHDEAGLLNSKTRLLSKASPSAPLGLESRQTAALAAVITLTSPSIPMIFMGQELAQTGPFHDDRPMRWELTSEQKGIFYLYKDLIALRRDLWGVSPALQSPRIKILAADNKNKLLAYRRYIPSKPESDLVVIINLADSAARPSVPMPSSGTWYALLSTSESRYRLGDTLPPPSIVAPSNRRLELNMPPRSAIIFGKKAPPQRMPTPTPASSPEDTPSGEEVEVKESLDTQPTTSSPNPLRLLANFTTPPWDRLRDDLVLGEVEPDIWQIELSLEAPSGFEFQIIDESSGLQFGSSEELPVPFDGALSVSDSRTRVPGPLGGDYRMTFNRRTLRFQMEARHSTSLDRVNIVSSQNGWSRIADPMFMDDDYEWRANLEVAAGEPFEFVICADGSWDSQWGAAAPPEDVYALAPSENLTIPAAPMGYPIALSSSSGGYRIVFDERRAQISVSCLLPEELPPPAPLPQPRPAPASARSGLEWNVSGTETLEDH